MNKKIIHLLENILEEVLVGAVIAGCAISPLIKNKKEIKQYLTSVKTEIKIPEFRQGNILGISEGDAFLLEPRFLSEESIEKPKQEFLTDEEIKNYINDIYQKISLPKYISKEFGQATIYVESKNNLYAISEKGARGLCGIMENTWSAYKDSNLFETGAFNAKDNIEVMYEQYKTQEYFFRQEHPNWGQLSEEEKLDFHLAGYNWGIGKLKRNGFDLTRIPEETENHIERIKERLTSTLVETSQPSS